MADGHDIHHEGGATETAGERTRVDLRAFLSHAAAVTGAPIALLSASNSEGAALRLAHGLRETAAPAGLPPLADAVHDAAIAVGGPLTVANMRRASGDAAVSAGARVRLGALADRGVGAALTAPLTVYSGRTCGMLGLLCPRPRRWTARDRDAVNVAATALGCALALQEADAAQAEILGELFTLNEALSTQSADLSMARVAAERALQRQTSFLAGLSHELRTPLNGVLGGLALLDTATDEAKRAKFQKMIRASAKTLGECVDDLLTYCRLGAGIEEPEFTDFDPRAAAAEAVEAAAAFATEKGLAISAAIDPTTPPAWRNDGRRIAKLLVNLLGNAVKYTAEGSVMLSVAPMGDDLAFRVIDTGRGVPPDMAEAIFEPFNRGDPATARSAQGTGLGLAIARETAHRLGGALTLERSAPGEGSTFLLRAPRRDCAAEADDMLFGG